MKPTIRCSDLDQLLNCGASRVLKPLVRPRTGGEGHEGTFAHWATADRLIREMGATPPPGGLQPPEVPAGYKLAKNSEWLVHYFVNLMRHSVDPANCLMVEQPLAYEFDRFILSGHQDLIEINPEATFAHGRDWKCGRNPVAPANCNSQGLGYIVLTKRAWPTLQQQKFSFAQPHNNPEDGHERVTTVEVEGAMLERCCDALEEQVNEALDRHDEIVTGMTQCAWCPVGTQCPGIQAEIENMKLKLTPEMLAKIRREADDATLGDIIIAARTVARAIEDAEDLLHERLDKATEVHAGSGTVITRKIEGGSYKVIDPVAMFAAAQEIIPAELLAKALNYPKARLTDAIAEAMDIPKGGKTAPVTGETVFAAKFLPHMEQGTRKKLIFT